LSLLGVLRSSTDAEYAFASAAILPVVLVAWAGGAKHGIVAAIAAVTTWIGADILSGRRFDAAWIPYVNGLARLITYSFAALMTARVRALLDRERELSSYDALTGILNRRSFNDIGNQEVARAERYAHAIAVVFLDLDNFKMLNDRQGHGTGDAALTAVASALKSTLRTTDTLGRLGGDEFAIILPEIDHLAANHAAGKIAAAMHMALAEYPPVTASIGLAWFESVRFSFREMMEIADALMYEIKHDGKSNFRVRLMHRHECQ
jgi:diguanylate cyclase (GGDEF)-like protein